MTLNANDVRDEYTASAGQTVFNYTFKIYESTDLDVYVTPAGQECSENDLTTAYSVAGIGSENGGTITLTTPTSASDLVTIVSSIPTSRTTDYQNNGDFRPDTVNDDFDKAYSLVKQIEDTANRSLQFPPCQQGVSSLTLPPPVSGAFLRFKGDLSGMETTLDIPVNVTDQTVLSTESYADLRVILNGGSVNDGDPITITDEGISGDFVIFQDVAGGNFTDDGGIVITASGITTSANEFYAVRRFSGSIQVDWFGAKPEFSLSGTTLPSNDSATAINLAYTYARTNMSGNENDLLTVAYSTGARYLVNSTIDAGLANSDFSGCELSTDQNITIINFYGTRQLIQNGRFFYNSVTSNSAREAIEYGSTTRQFSKNTVINLTTRNAYRGAVAKTSNLTMFGNVWINCRCDNNYDWAWYLDCKTGSTSLQFINCQARGLLSDGTPNKGMYISATNEAIFTGGFYCDQMADGQAFYAVNCRVVRFDYLALESCEITSSSTPYLARVNGGTLHIGNVLCKVALFGAGDGIDQDVIQIDSTTTFAEIGNIEVSQTQATDPADEDVSVTSLTQTGGTATATIGSHSWANGDTVTIDGANESEYNGDFVISNVTATTFDYTVDSGATSPATGTITATRIINGTLYYIDGNNTTQIFADNTPLSKVDTGGNNQLFSNRGDTRGYVNSAAFLPSDASESRYVFKNQTPAAGEFDSFVSDGSEYHITQPIFGGERVTATTAQFSDISDVVNTKGKWTGKIVPNTSTGLSMQATGSAAGSDWQPSDGGTPVTPS